MKYNLSLSKKASEANRFEVYVMTKVKASGKVITMRAKSGIYIDPSFFVGEQEDAPAHIDKKDKARIITPEIKYHREMATKLQSLLDFVDGKVQEVNNHRKDKNYILPYDKEWLNDAVKEFLNIKTLRNDSEIDALFHSFYSREKKPFSTYHIIHIKAMTRDIHRYIAYVRLTENHSFTFEPSIVNKEMVENFLSYLRNELSLLEEDYVTPNNTIILAKDIKAKVMAANCDCDGVHSDALRDRGENTIIKKANMLHSFFVWANKKKLIDNDPFIDLEIDREKYGAIFYPTIEERNKIAATPMPTPSLERAKDIFILQSLLGCRISDLRWLNEDMIVGDILKYTPKKTEKKSGMTAKVAITDMAWGIIKKYRNDPLKKGNVFLFIPSLPYLNREIKEVFKVAGIDRKVQKLDPLSGKEITVPLYKVATTHIARKCCLGNAYKMTDDPDIINKIGGHVAGSKAAFRYREVGDDKIRKVMDKVTNSHGNMLDLSSLSPDKLVAIQAIINQ